MSILKIVCADIPNTKAVLISGVMKRGETIEEFVNRLVEENKVVFIDFDKEEQ